MQQLETSVIANNSGSSISCWFLFPFVLVVAVVVLLFLFFCSCCCCCCAAVFVLLFLLLLLLCCCFCSFVLLIVVVVVLNQASLPTPLYSVLVSVSVFMAPSTVFLSTNSLRFLTLFVQSYLCRIGHFKHTSLHESLLQPWYNPYSGWLGSKHQLTNWLLFPSLSLSLLERQ